LKVAFRPAARDELEAGASWYESKSPGLGLEFVKAVKVKVDLIIQSPLMYQEAMHGTRRAALNRFPYVIYFRINGQRLVILAVFHSSRKPTIWQRRQ
jgi:plasmid stabilization system protein ParE